MGGVEGGVWAGKVRGEVAEKGRGGWKVKN
jgi:hypothetical protein